MLIPTSFKTKLSAEFSYPVGAELISEHLEGVPQLDELKLWFSDSPVYRKSEFREILDANKAYQVVDVTFYNRGIPRYDGWHLRFYPVRRALKKIAEKSIVSHGLPMLNSWLKNHQVSSPIGGVRCLIMFDPVTGGVFLREPLTGYEQHPTNEGQIETPDSLHIS